MRTRLLWMILPVLAFATPALQAGTQGEPRSLSIQHPEGLNAIAGIWKDAYSIAHPDVAVSVSVTGSQELKRSLSKPGSLGLVSGGGIGAFRDGSYRVAVVGRDILVPVVNSRNPWLELILSNGISPAGFGRAFGRGEQRTWGTVMGTELSDPVHTCVEAGSTGFIGLPEFLEVDAGSIMECSVKSRQEFLEKIRGEVHALGFCRLCDIVSHETGEILDGLALVPIDVNGNGTIDPFEDIYRSARDLSRGVWIGKYPAELYTRIYAVIEEKQETEAGSGFLEWAFSDGQDHLADAGLTALMTGERRAGLNLLRETGTGAALPAETAGTRSWMIAGMALIALALLFWLGSRAFRRGGRKAIGSGGPGPGMLDVTRLRVPGGMFFERNHTWVFMERDGEVRTGLDDFIPRVTGRLTGVRMMEPGKSVKKGQVFLGLVQKGKRMEIPSPVSGLIREHNSRLNLEPWLLNDDPLSDGWVYLIQPVNWLTEVKSYLMGEKYRELMRSELGRLRDFLSSVVVRIPGEAHPVMQEGGEISEGVLEGLGPEEWEEFQSKFIHKQNR